MNVSEIIERVRPLYRERTFMHFRDQAIGFDQFAAIVQESIDRLGQVGVKAGDRVVILATNKPEWLAGYFAILSLGAILVPVNPALTKAEISFIVTDCEPVAAFVDANLCDRLDAKPDIALLTMPDARSSANPGVPSRADSVNCVDVDPRHPAIIFYTSGTTGSPKGAVLSHQAVSSTIERTSHWIGASPQSCTLIAGSFAFIMHSTMASVASLVGGATLVLQERFHPGEALEAAKRFGVTTLMWVPTMYLMAVEWAEKHDVVLPALKVCNSGGAHLPWALCQRFKDRFGVAILNGWGMTEGTPITGYDFRIEEGRAESIGKVLPECELIVVDDQMNEVGPDVVGQLVFRSPSNMNGYYKRPDATAETIKDGWIYSGDLGRKDADGYFYLVGRSKDMIIRGGANIYPAEIEECLAGLDAISQCAVIGVPDPRFGEQVVAFVVVKARTQATASDLSEYLTDRLASYKIPQHFEIVDSLPLGPTGKVLKRVLRDQYIA